MCGMRGSVSCGFSKYICPRDRVIDRVHRFAAPIIGTVEGIVK